MFIVNTGFPPGMLEGGSKLSGGSGGTPPGENKLKFLNFGAQNGLF